MATHDYNIANASGSAVRTDLNNVLAAIVSNNSNATEPATTFAFQWWADTTANVLKLRNAANDDWVEIIQLDGEYTSIGIEDGTAAAPSLFFKDSGTDTGLFSPADDEVSVATAGSQRVTVDSSGRLLIGTDTSSNIGSATLGAFLQLEATDQAGSRFSMVRRSAGSVGPALILAKSGGGANEVVADGDTLGTINFVGADGTDTTTTAARIQCAVSGTPGENDMPASLSFFTTPDGASAPVAHFVIDSRGQTIAWADDDPSTSHILSTGRPAGTSKLIQGRNSGNDTDNPGLECFIVRANGDVDNTNNSYGAISDIKLKENIVDAGSQWDDIKELRVRKYNFKEETGHQTHTQIGLIAQEVESVSPGLVRETPDLDDDDVDLGTTTKQLRYSILYIKAIKALQEAMTRIEELETKVAALEGGAE